MGPRGLCRPLDEKQGFSKAIRWNLPAWCPGRFWGYPPPPPKKKKTFEDSWCHCFEDGCRWEIGTRSPFCPDPRGTATRMHILMPLFSEICHLLYCLTVKRSIAGRRHYSPRIPKGFTLPHRSDGTLGREPRAPMQMVSAALGSFVFRV